MNERQSHFRLFGVPVRVELGFFIVALFALQTRDAQGAAIWALAVFLGVLVHELGHAFAMRQVGETPFVTLHALGGVTQGLSGTKTTARQDLLIALSGPITGLLFGGFIVLVSKLVPATHPLVDRFVADSRWINVGWSFVNLLPLIPWDGGLALDATLRWSTGKSWPRLVGGVAIVGGAAIIGAAAWFHMLLLGYFGLMSIINGVQRIAAAREAARSDAIWARVMNGDDVGAELRALIAGTADEQRRAVWNEMLAWVHLKRRDFAGARRAMTAMGNFAPSVSLRARLAADDGDVEQVVALLLPSATFADVPLLVSALLAVGRVNDALDAARRYPSHASLIAERLFHAGAIAECLTLSTELLEREHDGRHAYNQACCFVRLGREPEAIAALQNAKSLGFDVRTLLEDDDLASLRAHPEVVALL